MRDTDSNLPPLNLLEALRQHSHRPYRHRRLTRSELRSLEPSKLVERGTADDLFDAIAERYWHWKEHPDGGWTHRQLTSRAYDDMFSIREAACRKKAGLSVDHIVRRLAEEKVAIWAAIERYAAARKVAGMDTAWLDHIIARRKQAAE